MSETTELPEIERPNGFPVPPLLPLAGLLGGLLADWFLPGIPGGWITSLAGVALVGLGVWVAAKAVAAMTKAGASPLPNSPELYLATEGVFAVSRNPIYLAFLIILTGIGLTFRSAGVLIAVPVVGLLLYVLVIRSEEEYLAGRFGAEYEAYRARVRRWI
ncbi:MAG: isoprenylcysteine carboxylmethyltransferase family protein [Bauldia sp.]|nr:isoprenylcysteine carboxylmethyltransferase family protein [Bauldia sp.]